VSDTVNRLFGCGCEVVYERSENIHVSGHGGRDELTIMLSLVKPKFFVPVHGEYRHLYIHAKLAQSVGIPKENTFVMEDGDVLELDRDTAKVTGHVSSSNVYVDGLSVGDIGNVVLRDRQMLSRDGIVIVIITIDQQTGKVVGRPDIVSAVLSNLKDMKKCWKKAEIR